MVELSRDGLNDLGNRLGVGTRLLRNARSLLKLFELLLDAGSPGALASKWLCCYLLQSNGQSIYYKVPPH